MSYDLILPFDFAGGGRGGEKGGSCVFLFCGLILRRLGAFWGLL